jgi:hypothetical protein
MRNLLQDTRDCIAVTGHTEADIIFIGSQCSGYQCTWDEFCVLADKEYNPDSDGQEVAEDLIIVFSDGEQITMAKNGGSLFIHSRRPV